ncbi:unnamed protein product [Diplocarpon coronariae]
MQFSILPTLGLLASVSATAIQLQARTNGWSVLNFKRSSSGANSPVTYSLVINNYGTNQNCTIIDNTNPALYNAWYDLPCQETPDYHLSWGWDYKGDFTVLTIESFPGHQKAYFGYTHPNNGLPGTVAYDNQGPNVPHTLNSQMNHGHTRNEGVGTEHGLSAAEARLDLRRVRSRRRGAAGILGGKPDYAADSPVAEVLCRRSRGRLGLFFDRDVTCSDWLWMPIVRIGLALASYTPSGDKDPPRGSGTLISRSEG